MKLLFDQNLSARLALELHDLFPGSRHVRDVGLSRADDSTVWMYAKEHGFTLVSKDSDFHQMSLMHGAPPKVVWIRRGNCTTSDAMRLLQRRHKEIIGFESDADAAFLAIH